MKDIHTKSHSSKNENNKKPDSVYSFNLIYLLIYHEVYS